MKKLVIAGLVIAAAVVAAAATLKRQTEEKPSKVSGRHAGDTRTITLPGGATVELCWCPPGSFLMGSPASEEGRFDDETQRPVTLAQGFWLGRYEVTQRQWESVMGTNPSCFRSPDRPVEQVSWEECQAFFRAMRNAVPGLRCRLPTEAEWEYACRAGTKTMRPDEELELAAWYRGNAEGESHPVGGKAANAWGL
ncbi:MAG: formylglycine-generating enzyme family protein, partial [Kiritimatiellia bacterium]